MKPQELLESKRYFYHVTETSNVSEILKYGLIPQIGRRSEYIGETVPAIYLFKNTEDAEDAVSNWLGDLFDEAVSLSLLRVRLPMNATVLNNIGTDIYEVVCKSPIPPENIQILKTDF